MNESFKKNIDFNKAGKLRGQILSNENLASYTSWRVGGCADQLYKPADIDDLALFLSILPAEEPLTFLGAASNVLIRDKGVRGTTILLKNTLKDIKLLSDDIRSSVIRAEAGAESSKFGYYTANIGLSGLEFLSGIPGTVGGALAMNAGSYGLCIWDSVIAVETVSRFGEINIRQPKDFEIGYRFVKSVLSSLSCDEFFIAGHFKLPKSSRAKSLAKIKEMSARRRNSQPLNLPNAGSVFRNPKGYFAARLIQDCSLKGFHIGGVRVSDKHANFIVNEGNGKAEDIESLINHIINVVEKEKGIRLAPEIKILGEI